ncbi:hypothetical protein [Lacticaseibacillus paracasei]|uniref:hypothetical protein n=1 Tax=Lacticaseibacillus paracasei TaxID=1597 RepID=UPI0011C81F45|nr:hypothetical protein [Lacticaseibacillus paracasei]TXJ66247.1 hypothetical protein FGO89_03570 [Lacticaseibacillus paracasei]
MSSIKHYNLPADDKRTSLTEGVKSALLAVPMHFMSSINITGISATDLFSMNTLLGGAIEDQTVATLNASRSVWDPEDAWSDCEFKRYSESFPDVRLERNGESRPIIGIELKGWYLLSKEEVPSFRFKAAADATTVWDILAVFPWSLSNVISGSPVLAAPFIEQAKYVADLRTHYWENRSPKAKLVRHPTTTPYPAPGTTYSDIAVDDGGNNFGRIARIKGLMDDWVLNTMSTPLAGISARWWVRFLKLFDERGDEETIRKRFEQIAAAQKHDPAWTDEVVAHVRRLMEM